MALWVAGRRAPETKRKEPEGAPKHSQLEASDPGFNPEKGGHGAALFFWLPPDSGLWASRFRGELSRSWALLQIEDGSFTKITRKAAFQLIDAGDFEILRQRPLSISLIQHKDFQDEQRHASGRRIPGVTKPPFNGKSSTSSGIRCRPPRSCVNWDYVKTSILANQFKTEREERQEEEARKEARKQNRKRRRARRRRKK